MRRLVLVFLWLLVFVGKGNSADDPPKSLDARLKVELFAEHPQIVTPTGIDVDDAGRVWAIESNTHFPPADYQGHPTDRVLVLGDTDGDGRADQITVFTDGLMHTMSLLVRPAWSPAVEQDGKPAPKRSVFIATRNAIFLYHDDDGDDRADRHERLVHLETTGNYPHNGLAGLAIDALGWLYFGFGENLGADYQIFGSDGTTYRGGGEGGNVYRCRLDGSQLSPVATGFWNPHASCVDALGRLFTVDNDADSRPPCRLLHVIPGGDYGYRFRNGRKGLHPFTAWNGEIPGTLPMVAGTGEAPSGILAYESDGLPEDYLGNLLVTSWGDHRIDRFRLQPKGTSFTSLAEPVITGGENFRPVGIACAPDGSLYCTDWVLREYKLHGHGRIWRISPTEHRRRSEPGTNAVTKSIDALKAKLADRRLPVRRLAAQAIVRQVKPDVLSPLMTETLSNPRAYLELWWAGVAANLHAGKDLSVPDDPFLKFSEQDPASTWLLLQPLIRKTARASQGPITTEAESQRRQLKTCEELLAAALEGRPANLVDQTSLLPYLHHVRIDAQSQLLRLTISVDDPFLYSTLISLAAVQFTPDDFARHLEPDATPAVKSSPPKLRQAMLLAARKQFPREDSLLRVALADHDPEVRRLAVQWAAEERLTDLKSNVEAVFNGVEMTSELFLATLAALEMLNGKSPADFDKTPAAQYVVPLLKDESRSPAVRRQALRLVSPVDPALDEPFFAGVLQSDDPLLRLEAIRTLQGAKPDVSGRLLRKLAADGDCDLLSRAEAVVGLARAAQDEPAGGPSRTLLKNFINGDDPVLQREALRAARPLIAMDAELRSAVQKLAGTLERIEDRAAATELADQVALAWTAAKLDVPETVRPLTSEHPLNRVEWMAQLNRGREVDAEAGRRLFFHPNGPGCFKCHIINGRGGRVGPDLSRAVGAMNRIQLIQSILEPSREIAPQYVSWTFETHGGKVVNGMIVHENEGKTVIGNAAGELIELQTADIAQRTPQKISVMPDKLADRMTLQELRDLLAFLDTLR